MVPLSFENSQLLTERKVFKDQVSFALEYESEQSKDELGKDFQGCFLPNITIELILNRYSGSLHKSLKLKKLEFLSRTGIIIYSRWKSNFLSVSVRKNGKGRMQ